MRFVFVLPLLLLPTFASAQSITVLFQQSASELAIDPSDCDSTVAINWSIAAGTVTGTCSELQFWVTAGKCGDEPAAGDFEFDPIPTNSWGPTVTPTPLNLDLEDLPFASTSDAGVVSCGTEDVEVEMRLCGRGQIFNALGTGCAGSTSDRNFIEVSPEPIIRYDAKDPAPPTLGEVRPLDARLRVSYEAPDDAESVRLQYREADQTEAEYIRLDEVSADEESAEIDGLRNGVTYEIRATAIDQAGNESALSEPVFQAPQETRGFWGECQAVGCEEGGCASAGGLSLVPVLVGVVGLWLRRRNRQ